MQKALDALLKNPNQAKLIVLTKLFNSVIPFNAPHRFKFLKISDTELQISLPYKRINKNHLGGIHAGAIATLGEFSAGVLLLKNFGMQNYRYILSKLSVEYHYQAKKKIIGTAQLAKIDIEKIKNELASKEKVLHTLTTEVRDASDNHIATVKSTWQLKLWSKVKTK